jgi:hypothetical protein
MGQRYRHGRVCQPTDSRAGPIDGATKTRVNCKDVGISMVIRTRPTEINVNGRRLEARNENGQTS